ncbi:MAG TPA: hypothetical protein VFK68_11305 [Propionibacteriaceae bacterium]|nr:hypothetical protein [Propionibacteriaceae bacterium]
MAAWHRRTIAAAFLGAALALVPLPAHADGEKAASYVVDGTLRADGTLSMSETLTFDGPAPATLTQRLATFRDEAGGVRYAYDITDIRAVSDGKDLQPKVTSETGYTVVSVPTASVSQLTISYSVRGATTRADDGVVDFSWRVLQGLSVPVVAVSGSVGSEVIARDYTCVSGPPTSTGTCSTFTGGTHGSQGLEFTDGPRGQGEVVTVGMRFDRGTLAVTQHRSLRWSLDRAFTPGWPQVLAALGALVVGGALLWLLYRRTGRDATSATPRTVARFVPVGAGESDFQVVDDVRPGHVGTLADEHVDPLDVIGTILDLAVRGHLLITQLPPEGGITDWALTRRAADDQLSAFEARLLDGIAPLGGQTRVSELAAGVIPAVAAVQDDLYDEVVSRGWFLRRPDKVRALWSRLAWAALGVAVVVLVVLVAFTTYGLLGLALVALAVALLVVADEMPSRTASGTALLAGLRVLAMDLDTAPTDQLPKGKAYATVSRILPYAVVLGGWERWVQVLARSDDDVGVPDPTDLSWFHAPADWQLEQLPASLDAFVNAARGRLFAR